MFKDKVKPYPLNFSEQKSLIAIGVKSGSQVLSVLPKLNLSPNTDNLGGRNDYLDTSN